jgi:hypothetical protein
MPRFGTKSLLIVVGVVALWLSTFAGYRAGHDVQASILLTIFIGSAVAALCYSGKRRAFWGSFFGVMLLCGGNDFQRPLHRYAPSFLWPTLQAYAPLSPMTYVPQPVLPTPPLPPTVAAGATLFPAPVAVAPMPAPMAMTQVLRREVYSATLAALWTLALATVVGFIGVFIYNQSLLSCRTTDR